jgi:hypothetical protein
MQHIDTIRVFQRVHRSECIAAKILNDFKHPLPHQNRSALWIAMLAAALRDINRIAHLMLDKSGNLFKSLRLDPIQTTGLRGVSSVI